jgi:hypothetical protein
MQTTTTAPQQKTAQEILNLIKENGISFHSDPGHGWLKVPMKLLEELDIKEKITEYSYQSHGFAYLEEDCDLMVFLTALCPNDKESQKFFFHQVPQRYSDRDSFIRNMPSF